MRLGLSVFSVLVEERFVRSNWGQPRTYRVTPVPGSIGPKESVLLMYVCARGRSDLVKVPTA